MKLEKIILKNYRQFRDLEIKLDKNMHVILGIMGTGKTNLLNALNWCLYQEEPYLSKTSEKLPLLNLKTINNANEKTPQRVIVEIWVKIGDNRRVIFTRNACFVVTSKGKNKEPVLYEKPNFTVKTPNEGGGFDIHEDEDAQSEVNRFFPKSIREFFFFDGERLDRYFREVTGQQIRHEVFVISRIELLRRIEGRLDKIITELTRDAGRQNPLIQRTADELEQKKNARKETIKQMGDCDKQIKIAKEKVKEFSEKLQNVPEIEDLEKRRDTLKELKKEKRELHKGKLEEKKELLSKSSKIIMLYPAIEKTIRTINKMREKKEIPPQADASLLKDIIELKTCTICGTKFTSESKEEKNVKNLLNEIKSKSEIGTILSGVENPLNLFKDEVNNFEDDIKRINKELKGYKTDLQKIEDEINEISKTIGGYDKKKIKEWNKQLTSFDGIYEENEQKKGVFISTLKELDGKIEELEKNVKKEIEKEEKVKELNDYITFCKKSLKMVNEVKKIIMERVKKQIENIGNKRFSELMWKKKTYKRFYFDKNYDLHLQHQEGFEALGTISGGEREVLALSFTSALHEVSGYDSPMVIDRPYAMVSGKPLEYVSEVFSNLSKQKQIILLLTPTDYKNVISFLDKKLYDGYELKLMEDEKEVIMEVL